MLTSSDLRPRTHNALNDFHQSSFHKAIASGDLEPYVWPYCSFGTFVLLAYLLLPPTNSRIVHHAFYPVFAFFSWWSLRAILETKSASLAATYGIGLVNAWAILWIAARMLFTDYRAARRVERRSKSPRARQVSPGQDSPTSTAREQNGAIGRTVIKCSDGIIDVRTKGNGSSEYYWQTLPFCFIDRVSFVVDLLFSMRGPGWEHQARSIPGPPKHIAAQLNPSPPMTRSVVKNYADRSSLLWTNGIRFLKCLVYLDIIKTLMTYDPYFLGFVDPSAPAPSFLPALIRRSHVLTKWYRLILSMFATRTTLSMIFCLSPLFFSGILGPRFMGLRAEAWYYPDFNGDWQYLLSDGIAAWWGTWWHQIFRLGFEAPSRWICDKFNLSPKSPRRKIIGVITAFLCSGLLHGLASISTIPETKPWSGPLTFFLLQALGIMVEGAVGVAFRKTGITHKVPQLIRHAIMIIWLAVWAYYTGPLIVDDFSRGGVWLFEPVPFSLLKMLGFGEPNDHWWRWRARNIFWHTGDRWWKSGIAL